VRTEEQIQADLQAAYDAMEREARKPERKWPCEECRWSRGLRGHGYCHNPLVKQFDRPEYNFDVAKAGGFLPIVPSKLCGPEKALWEAKPEPKQTLCGRILSFLTPHKKG